MRVFPFLVALLLTACVSAPVAEREAPVPAETPAVWTAASGETDRLEVSDTWWEAFGDPRLTAVVEEALRRSPTLDAAAARIRQAEALAVVAGADRGPSLSGAGQASRQRQFTGKTPFADETQRADNVGVSLNVTWELDLWRRIQSGEAAAVADVEAARALHHGAALSLAAQTAKAYLTVVDGRLQLEIAEADLASALELVERVRDRFQRGTGGALQIKLAESEVAGARAVVHAQRRLLDLSRRQLEILAGRYPSGDVDAAEDLPEPPAPVPAGVPADVLASRPDLVAAERRLAASGMRVKEAQASLYPRIALTGSRGLASDGLSDILSGDFGVWSLVGSIAAPIWEGGRLRANVDLQGAREAEAVAKFANAVLVAFFEVEASLAAETHLAEQTTALRRAVADAGESVELSEERYLAGLVDILSVLEARRRHLAARRALAGTRRDLLSSRVDLYVALGGGFHRELVAVTEVES